MDNKQRTKHNFKNILTGFLFLMVGIFFLFMSPSGFLGIITGAGIFSLLFLSIGTWMIGYTVFAKKDKYLTLKVSRINISGGVYRITFDNPHLEDSAKFKRFVYETKSDTFKEQQFYRVDIYKYGKTFMAGDLANFSDEDFMLCTEDNLEREELSFMNTILDKAEDNPKIVKIIFLAILIISLIITIVSVF
jgi:hypothetical protein